MILRSGVSLLGGNRVAFITCENVSFAYGGKTVLHDVSFSVNAGDYLCIVGENGSGKSTLIKGLLGLKAPETGKISYGDGLKPNGIGYLPQQSAAQKDFPASVFEVVLSGRLNRCGLIPFYRKADRIDADEKLALMGMETMKKQSFQALSGGQQQRVLLARALCATSRLLLLDEPVAGLDPVATASMYRVISEINQNHGITVIMVSHDIPAAVKYANRILQLGHKQLFFGKTSDYTKSTLGSRFLNPFHTAD